MDCIDLLARKLGAYIRSNRADKMSDMERLKQDPRVTVRRDGPLDPDGRCVLVWVQRAQRATDNPALDLAIAAGNALRLPVVAFLGLVPAFPNGNWRHYQFLVDGVPD